MENNSKAIYVIMVCSKLEAEIYPSGEKANFSNYGSTRIVGFYTKFSDADRAIRKNICDVWETCYNYACIEKVSEGVYHPGTLMGWYKFNTKKEEYEPIETPLFDVNTHGRTIG